MKIILIAAIGLNNQIGKDNKLLWHSQRDLQHFKDTTDGKTILMGRKTFESLPGILPNRKHIVISRKDLKKTGKDVHAFTDLEEALRELKELGLKELIIIGGSEIYHQTIKIADEMIISKFNFNGEADSFFPEINMKNWKIVKTFRFQTDEKELQFVVQNYGKRF